MHNTMNITNTDEVQHEKVVAPYVRLVENINNTWLVDVRFTQPNTTILDQDCVHSIEHMIMVALRSIAPKQALNFGIMGCRTGFYLNFIQEAGKTMTEQADCLYEILMEAMNLALTMKEVPLCTPQTCGNYVEHDIAKAKTEIQRFVNAASEHGTVY